MPDGSPVATLAYNMQELFETCVQRHIKRTGGVAMLRIVPTPFLAEEKEMADALLALGFWSHSHV